MSQSTRARTSNFARTLLRFLLVWVVDAISLLLTATLYAGISFAGIAGVPVIVQAFAATFLLSIVNLLIRPLILLLARPLGFIAVFIIGFLVNGAALLITSFLLPTFEVSGWISAIVGGLVFAAINVFLTGIAEANDDGSFYQGVIERLARRRSFTNIDPQTRGLVLMEIDGLSYHHLKKALADGLMPSLEYLMDNEGYVLSHVDCGIPSQTSACQAGIMFGDNTDIPAFRWYDKDKRKLYVSGNDATELNGRYANGNGLMRGGSSINNMLNGDADKSLLTLAGMFDGDAEEKKRRAEDVYLLMLNPYFLTRTIIFLFVDVVREVWQGWQQRRRDIYPRLNRLAHGYPFVRAITTVFMRDIAANLTILDIIRGAPTIYVTWPGYDEVAHHSGPWTGDAFKVLKTYDSTIARVYRTIRDKAPRPYDLIILSDHGQSFGPTFKQRYGISLKEFIEQLLPQGITVAQSMGGDTGVISLNAASGELSNIRDSGVGGIGGQVIAERGQRVLDNMVQEQESSDGTPEADKPAQVTAYGSGNLAQVYFDLLPRKISLNELNQAYPAMVDTLVSHEGIGIVCGYEDDGTPVVLGKSGRRNLHTGALTGEDPLLMYAPDAPDAFGHASLETRAWQVRRVMDFPHAGDLMVISTVYPDGTVAALEELIGNHGGLGGEQTDAFLFHPADMRITQTRNSADVFHILNDHRDLPLSETPREPADREDTADDWSPGNLWSGIKDVSSWMPLLARALVFDRLAYVEIAGSGKMTGPALLIGCVFAALAGGLRTASGLDTRAIFGNVAWWFVGVLAILVAGRLLNRSSGASYTQTMRAVGFAQAGNIIGLAGLIPPLAPLALFASTVYTFCTVMMGAAIALQIRGWRVFVLPVVMFATILIFVILARLMFGGIALSIESVLGLLGLSPTG